MTRMCIGEISIKTQIESTFSQVDVSIFQQYSRIMSITYIVNFIFLILGFGFLLSITVTHLIPLLLRWYFPLFEIPGPGLTRWSRLWLLVSFISGNGDIHLVNANKKYGMLAVFDKHKE